MKKPIKIILICLSAISLNACKTLEIVHVDLKCRLVPSSNERYTDEEIEQTPDSVINKFLLRSNQLKARIETVCNDIKAHNTEHSRG